LRIGVQTKVLEALASGTPVVTTAAGNSGIGAKSGVHLWVADEPMEYAARVVQLLRGDQWDDLSKRGMHLVKERFTWARSAMELESHISSFH
jgi:glycosyltransferase involved in cell wall biosynthesis